MQEVEVLKTIPELVCSYFSEEQFTLSQIIKFLHILCRSSILYITIAVDVFGLHLEEPDASGSFFW